MQKKVTDEIAKEITFGSLPKVSSSRSRMEKGNSPKKRLGENVSTMSVESRRVLEQQTKERLKKLGILEECQDSELPIESKIKLLLRLNGEDVLLQYKIVFGNSYFGRNSVFDVLNFIGNEFKSMDVESFDMNLKAINKARIFYSLLKSCLSSFKVNLFEEDIELYFQTLMKIYKAYPQYNNEYEVFDLLFEYLRKIQVKENSMIASKMQSLVDKLFEDNFKLYTRKSSGADISYQIKEHCDLDMYILCCQVIMSAIPRIVFSERTLEYFFDRFIAGLTIRNENGSRSLEIREQASLVLEKLLNKYCPDKKLALLRDVIATYADQDIKLSMTRLSDKINQI